MCSAGGQRDEGESLKYDGTFHYNKSAGMAVPEEVSEGEGI
jgi:hypothetical protein